MSKIKKRNYEYGAHFEYKELYIALKNLQLNQKNENIPSGENNNFPLENENNEEVFRGKKRKKYKIKTLNKNEYIIHLLTEGNQKDIEKNKFSIIEEEEDNKKSQIIKEINL